MKIENLQYLSDEDLQVWDEFNSTEKFYEPQGTIVDMFYRAAAEGPARAAISVEGQDLSYAELNERSNQVADFLLRQGAQAGETIGVAFSRNHHLYVAILGIIKAGFAYVPIDVEHPLERVRYILDDSGVRVLLTEKRLYQEAYDEGLDESLMQVVLDGDIPAKSATRFDVRDIQSCSTENVRTAIAPQQPVYVIYTSGTTGKPKGVKISHDNLVNFIHWFVELHEVSFQSRLCQNAPITFDPSAQQIFPALAVGATLIPIPERILHDPYLLLAWLREERITHFDVVTPHWVHLLNALEAAGEPSLGHLPDLQWIIIGGESLYYHQTHQWHRLTNTPARFNNVYGPTEATINATFFLVDLEKTTGKVPIGWPLPNYKIYVLDPNGNLCLPHVFGEIYIGGRGVALGYQNAEQTRKSFVPDSFSGRPAERLYKTGDLARLIVEEDGSAYIEFGGRNDSQVKISGYRIELEEIEATIKSLPQIQDAVVDVWGEDLNKHLVCFFVSGTMTQHELRKSLRMQLPAYMVPGAYVKLDELPRTQNEKTDRKKLLQLYDTGRREERSIVAPRTEMEMTIERIWGKLLNLDRISITDDFFELGANSFLSLTFLTQLQSQLGCRLRVADIYNHPSIAELASFLEDAERQQAAEAPHAPRLRTSDAPPSVADDDLPELSPAEIKALLERVANPEVKLTEIREFDLSPSNQMALRNGVKLTAKTIVDVALDFSPEIEVLERVVREIIAEHPLLRASVRQVADRHFKFIEYRFDDVTLPFADLSGYRQSARDDLMRRLQSLFSEGFTVTEPPLFRWLLLREGEHRYRLLWCLSHLISDGETVDIIQREVKERYRCHTSGRNFRRERNRISYDDYVKDIRSTKTPGIEVYAGYLESFIESVARVQPYIESVMSQERTFYEETSSLSFQDLPHQPGEDVVHLLYAICSTAVAAWTGVERVPFVSVYHGRDYGKGRNYFSVVGNLLDRVPLLLNALRQAEREQQLAEVARCLEAVNYRRVNYAWLIEQLSLMQSKQHIAQKLGSISYPFWLNFFEELEAREPIAGAAPLITAGEEYQEQEPGALISFTIIKTGERLNINLLAQGIKEQAMAELSGHLKRQVDAFTVR
jgi:nonribosomal peptide synthetase protein VioG